MALHGIDTRQEVCQNLLALKGQKMDKEFDRFLVFLVAVLGVVVVVIAWNNIKQNEHPKPEPQVRRIVSDLMVSCDEARHVCCYTFSRPGISCVKVSP